MELVGIDLGGSHCSCVVLSPNGSILRRGRVNITSDVRGDLETVMNAMVGACDRAGVIPADVKGVGVAIPGNVDPIRGVTRYLPNFGWTHEVPITQLLIERLGITNVRMRNDGRCAALAEARLGCGTKSKVFAMLTLGTGIGGALLIDGKPFDGCSFDSGDFGHHVICSGPEAMQCVCGKKGCFETHASAAGLVRHYTLAGGKGGEADDAKAIIDKMHEGDSAAITAFAAFKNDLSTGLANLITFYNPDTIALGGGLSLANELYDQLEDMVNAKTLPATRGKFTIVQAKLGTEASGIGAALLLTHGDY